MYKLQDSRYDFEMKIVALDIGEKRIGLAITLEEKIVFPLQTLTRTSLEQDLKNLFEKIQEYSVQKLVVGFPYHMNGQESAQSKKIKALISKFELFLKEQKIKIPIEFLDERLTSWEARERLDGKKAKKNKEAIDAMSASLILEDYLARNFQ